MSVSKQVYVTPFVEAGAGAFLSSFRYSKEGSSCLNGPQWLFDQYGRGPVPVASLSDDCPGSVVFLQNRLEVEQYARPEYYAKLNAAGIMGYENINNPWDALYGKTAQARSYLLGLETAQTSYGTESQPNTLESEAMAARKLGTSVETNSGLSF